MAVVEWVKEVPPESPGQTQRARWARIAAELRANPGQWALVAEDVTDSMPAKIRRDRLGAGFEVEWRRAAGSGPRANVYARYVGGELPPS